MARECPDNETEQTTTKKNQQQQEQQKKGTRNKLFSTS